MSDVNFFGFDSLFAARLRSLIDSKGISKQQLADAIGVSRQAISQYSDGSTIPNAEKLFKIAEYFDVSLDYLTGRTESFTIDEELKFVCDYTFLSENAVISLHECFTNKETRKIDFSNNFLDLLIEMYSFNLCDFAQKYKWSLKEIAKYKKAVIEQDIAGDWICPAMQDKLGSEEESEFARFKLKNTFDSLIDLFVKDEKAVNQDLDCKIRKLNLDNYFFR